MIRADLAGEFTEAMSRVVAGVAVVSARRADGRPCGLLVSSLCSYSIRPPSVLAVISTASRTYTALAAAPGFGVHLLGGEDEELARVFAGDVEDKFAGLAWRWDGAAPQLLGMPVYLRCSTRRLIPDGDHAMLLGEVEDCVLGPSEPLVYFRRRLDWRLARRDQATAGGASAA